MTPAKEQALHMTAQLRHRGDTVATQVWMNIVVAECVDLEATGLTDFGGADVLLHHLKNMASPCRSASDKWARRACKKAGRFCAKCHLRHRSAMEITSYLAELRSEAVYQRRISDGEIDAMKRALLEVGA